MLRYVVYVVLYIPTWYVRRTAIIVTLDIYMAYAGALIRVSVGVPAIRSSRP